MGLDVSAFGSFKVLSELASEAEREEAIRVWEHPEFPGRALGLPVGSYLVYQDACDEAMYCSYGRYNRRRAMLCQAALGVSPDEVWADEALWKGLPFVELIAFSDCEGIIGPVVAAKLAADFQAHRESIFGQVGDSEDEHEAALFRDFYDSLAACFESAADSGFVVFG